MQMLLTKSHSISETFLCAQILLTLKRIYSDLLSECERLLDLLLLNTLDAQALKGDGHGVRGQLQRADALLAALLAHQVVWVGPVGRLGGHARHHDHGATAITDNLRWMST